MSHGSRTAYIRIRQYQLKCLGTVDAMHRMYSVCANVLAVANRFARIKALVRDYNIAFIYLSFWVKICFCYKISQSVFTRVKRNTVVTLYEMKMQLRQFIYEYLS